MPTTNIKSLKLIIFDLDGTLVDSSADIVHAFKMCLHKRAIDDTSEQKIRQLIGKPLADCFYALLPPEMHHKVTQCAAAYRAYYFNHCLDHTQLFPNVARVLQYLRQNGYLLAIATTKQTDMALRILKGLNLAEKFDWVQGTDDLPAKPNPAILEHICHQLGQTAATALMVGDTDNDVLAAKWAGMMSCAVSWGAWQRDQLSEIEPDFLIDRLDELMHLLSSNEEVHSWS